ncbi:MAG: SulP family inorganic anion transporter, partial [Rectinemataceae bacterium]
IAAGGTPQQGLVTAVMAGFFCSLLGGSKFQISGPTGAFVVIIYGIISRQGMDGLLIATLLAGLMLIGMGISGLGKLIKYIPYPVTTGFTTGIGLLIFTQQIKDFLGLSIEHPSPEFFERWAQYVENFSTFNLTAFGIGVLTIVLILLVRKFYPAIPASVASVAIVTLLTLLARIPVETVGSRFGAIPAGFPPLQFPALKWSTFRAVFSDAFTIAMLAAIESLLSAVVADGMTGDRHKSNAELVAQGIGNIASALFGGIPATGAIARTATNIKAGARSPVSGMVHAMVLLAFMLFLSPVASIIPLASLAGVLIVVAFDMSDLERFMRIIRRAPRSDIIVLLTTFVITVVIDLTAAVEIGVLLAILLFFKRMIEVSGVRRSDVADQLFFRDTDAQPIPRHSKDIEVFEITGPFFFGVADMLQDTLFTLEKTPHVFLLDMHQVPAIDATGIVALRSFIEHCNKKKVACAICGLQEQPSQALEKAGILKLIDNRVFPTLGEGLAAFQK